MQPGTIKIVLLGLVKQIKDRQYRVGRSLTLRLYRWIVGRTWTLCLRFYLSQKLRSILDECRRPGTLKGREGLMNSAMWRLVSRIFLQPTMAIVGSWLLVFQPSSMFRHRLMKENCSNLIHESCWKLGIISIKHIGEENNTTFVGWP